VYIRTREYVMTLSVVLGVGIDRLTMIMTTSPSIQDVLFLPQMKPEKPAGGFNEKEFSAAGIRKDLFPVLQRLGINNLKQLREIKPSKLFNDVCGMRKKMKLEDVVNPTMEEVQGWFSE